MEKEQAKKEASKRDEALDIEIPEEKLQEQTKKEEKHDQGADYCWNCDNHGRTTKLEGSICPECGFDKNNLHNLYLGAERETKRRMELRAQGYNIARE